MGKPIDESDIPPTVPVGKPAAPASLLTPSVAPAPPSTVVSSEPSVVLPPASNTMDRPREAPPKPAPRPEPRQSREDISAVPTGGNTSSGMAYIQLDSFAMTQPFWIVINSIQKVHFFT